MDEAHKGQKAGGAAEQTQAEEGIKSAYPDQAARKTRQRMKEKTDYVK